MSFLQKTKAFLGFDEELVDHIPRAQQIRRPAAPAARPAPQRPSGKLLSFPQQRTTAGAIASGHDVVVLNPHGHEDSLTVSSYLKNGHPVIVNIKNLDTATGKRFIDFVCGSAYAFNGNMHRLGGTIFLFTPAHMGIIPVEETMAPMDQEPTETERLVEQIEDTLPPFEEAAPTDDDGFEYFDPMQEEEQPMQQYYAAAR